MAQTINTNVSSLNAQRNLNSSQGDLQTSLQRLSSGLRINSAKDDAAGLAISERFTTQIRGLTQAARNSSDGISLAQTSEGDLAQITNNLQRVRELAVQSANATNSESDRAALQLEAAQLISEIDRVASTSAFNGVKLLDGSFSAQQFQVGANAGETVSVASISSARTTAIGQALTATSAGTGPVAGAITAGELTVNGNDVGAVAQDALAIANAISGTSSNVSATATNAQTNIDFADVTGLSVTAATAGSVTLTAPGATDFSTEQVSFTVDGNAVVLDTNLADADALATEIGTDLGAAYAVSNAGGTITIANVATGAASTAPVIAAFNGDVDGNAAAATAGSASTTANISVTDYQAGAAVSFDVDGNAVVLDADYTNIAGVTAEIQADLDATAGAGVYTVSDDGTNITITNDVAGSTPALLIDNGTGTTAAEFTGATVTAGTDASGTTADFTGGGTSTAGADAVAGAGYSLDLDSATLDLTAAATDGTITAAELAGVVDALAGYTATVGGTATQINITKDDGSNFTLTESGTASAAQGFTALSTVSYGTVSVTSANEDLVIGGTNAADAGLGIGTTTAALAGTTIADTDVSTVAGANAAISSVDAALTTINSSRASLGAIQNRFESIVSSIATSTENLSAARSRILDADFASETAALTRNQILQQAGVSILSQANSLPQLVLSLLQ